MNSSDIRRARVLAVLLVLLAGCGGKDDGERFQGNLEGGEEGPFVQQLQGRWELEKNTAERLAGRVVLAAQGQLDVAGCSNIISADFNFRFDVPRP